MILLRRSARIGLFQTFANSTDRCSSIAGWRMGRARVMVQSPHPADAPESTDRLARCQQRLGYHFQDTQLLEAALTHASGADHRLSSNERLEFLGDAILGLVVCEQLFTQFPDQ